MISRRTLLHGALTVGGGLVLARPLRAGAQESPWGRLVAEYGTVRPPTFTRPLPLPSVLKPVRSDASGDVFELAMRAGTAQPLPGAPTPILGYDGRWPGPTIAVTRGRPARVRVRNE